MGDSRFVPVELSKLEERVLLIVKSILVFCECRRRWSDIDEGVISWDGNRRKGEEGELN